MYTSIVRELSKETIAELSTTTSNVARRAGTVPADGRETKRQRRRREAHATEAKAPDVSGDALGQFFKQASRYPLLTAEEHCQAKDAQQTTVSHGSFLRTVAHRQAFLVQNRGQPGPCCRCIPGNDRLRIEPKS